MIKALARLIDTQRDSLDRTTELVYEVRIKVGDDALMEADVNPRRDNIPTFEDSVAHGAVLGFTYALGRGATRRARLHKALAIEEVLEGEVVDE